MRKSSEHPNEQTKQIVRAKSSCQSQQKNASQSKASKHVRKQSMSSQANNFTWLSQSKASNQANNQLRKLSYLSKQI